MRPDVRLRPPVRPVVTTVLLAVLQAAGMAFAVSPLEGQSRVRTELDSTLVHVGDRLTLSVFVDHESDDTVVWPDSLDLAPFEVLGAAAGPTRRNSDRATSSAVYSLTVFELGEVELPAFSFDVVAADGTRESLETDRYGVEVVSVGADESGDIRDIRGPFFIRMSTVIRVLWLLLLAGGLMLMWIGYRRWRRAASPERAAIGPPPRPAHEVALEALDRLEASDMLSRELVKEYHIEVSDILRRYVEGRYRVPALEMTTWEIIGNLERVGVEANFCGPLRTLLDQCDLVKFAKVRPTDEESRGVLGLGRELVEKSVAWIPAEEVAG
jgi:hypothetical protein